MSEMNLLQLLRVSYSLCVWNVFAVRPVRAQDWDLLVSFRPVHINPHEAFRGLQGDRSILLKNVREALLIHCVDVTLLIRHSGNSVRSSSAGRRKLAEEAGQDKPQDLVTFLASAPNAECVLRPMMAPLDSCRMPRCSLKTDAVSAFAHRMQWGMLPLAGEVLGSGLGRQRLRADCRGVMHVR